MNPYQAYKQNSVTTASPKAIIIKLHEKALLELELAYRAWISNDLNDMRPHITKIQDIVSYLHSSLDPNQEISPTLSGLYRYYLTQLAKLFIEPCEDGFKEIRQHLSNWKDTWSAAS